MAQILLLKEGLVNGANFKKYELVTDIFVTGINIQASVRYQPVTDMDGNNYIYTFYTNARPITFQVTLLRNSQIVNQTLDINPTTTLQIPTIEELLNSRDATIKFFDNRFRIDGLNYSRTFVTVTLDSGVVFNIIPQNYTLMESALSPHGISASISAYLLDWINVNA